MSKKRVTKQARPLTVLEMKKLHAIASSPGQPINKRVIAAHFLLMAYGRCRNSDLVQVNERRVFDSWIIWLHASDDSISQISKDCSSKGMAVADSRVW